MAEINEKYVYDLTPEDWMSLSLRERIWNYITLVEYTYQKAHKRPFKFVIDKGNKAALGKIVDTLEEGLKWLLVMGEPGTGKTLYFRMLQKVIAPPQSTDRFRIMNTTDIVTDFNSEGYDCIKKYCSRHIIFNDLGFEPLGNHYSDKNVNVMDRIIFDRDEMYVSDGLISGFITNHTIDQLESKYDSRVIDRIRGFSEIVLFEGSSRRMGDLPNIILPEVFPINFGKPRPDPPKFTVGMPEKKSMGELLREKFQSIENKETNE